MANTDLAVRMSLLTVVLQLAPSLTSPFFVTVRQVTYQSTSPFSTKSGNACTDDHRFTAEQMAARRLVRDLYCTASWWYCTVTARNKAPNASTRGPNRKPDSLRGRIMGPP